MKYESSAELAILRSDGRRYDRRYRDILRPHRRPTLGAWLLALIIPKIIGFGAWYLIFRMCDYWDARGLIPEMSKTMQEEDDTWE